jgi:hypothetical protein
MTSPQERQPREQRHEIPHMTSLEEGHLREQNQGVKREHDIRFPKGEEHLHFEGDVCEDWMETTTSSKKINIYKNICSNNNSGHMKVYMLLNYKHRE